MFNTLRHEKHQALPLATLLLVGSPVLAACTTVTSEDAASAAVIQVTTYRDRDLRCRVSDGSYSKHAYDCDFTGFYADPTYTAPSSLPRIRKDTLTEHEVPYLNGVLHCLVFEQDHGTFAETCDYPRFHNETEKS